MKTIEERATEYACDEGVMPDSPECESCFNIYGKCTRDAYIAGANAEHKELTRWHNPFLKEMTPNNVIVKYIAVGDPANPYYTIGRREPSEFWDCECELATSAPRFEIVGWREIHENE